MNINAICFAMAAAALVLLPLDTRGATVSTPYVNTYSAPESTNDFALGASPANKASYVSWSLSGNRHYNLLDGAKAISTLYGWATLDFQDLGGVASEARNFDMQIAMQARSSVSTTTNYPGGFQGLCALASAAALDSYYYARVYFTNVVGNVIISKVVGGVEVLSTTIPTTITFDRGRTYKMELVGEYGTSSSPALTLTYRLSYGSETNTATLVDAQPLIGNRFGYRSCNNKGSCQVWWDDFAVESWGVREAGTVVVVR